jgi:O-antigen ligase
VVESLQRWTRWAGGLQGLALILALQLLMVLVFAIDARLIPFAALGVAGLSLLLERPVLAVGLLIVARLLSTGELVFARIGGFGIGPYEPALLVCALALAVRAMSHRVELLRTWPWQVPLLAFLAWTVLGLWWSPDRGDGLADVLPLVLVLCNALVILAFVRTWEDFRLMVWFWVGACVLIGVLTIFSDALGFTSTVQFKAASGGRETGLGQQPNWFAMNLMFIIHTCFGLALVERRAIVRVFLLGAGFFIFVMMLQAGSRGGAYATVIGGGLAALAHPVFRRWFARFAVATVVIFLIGIAFNVGDSAGALTRISTQTGFGQNYRELNWLACLQMFRDTWGIGIGTGGYQTLLPQYNNYIAQSLYDYPHGIFWQIIAHWGLPGLLLFGWIVAAIVRMSAQLIRMSKGTEAEVFAWTFPSAMFGYAAWSFVEFTVTEKPFWEFLALHTALYFIVLRLREEGKPIPSWTGDLPGLLRVAPPPAPEAR